MSFTYTSCHAIVKYVHTYLTSDDTSFLRPSFVGLKSSDSHNDKCHQLIGMHCKLHCTQWKQVSCFVYSNTWFHSWAAADWLYLDDQLCRFWPGRCTAGESLAPTSSALPVAVQNILHAGHFCSCCEGVFTKPHGGHISGSLLETSVFL